MIIQISSNGLLSFGSSYPDYNPTSFPLSSEVVVVAPFWDDIGLTSTGIVEYGVITSRNNPNIINIVETFLELNQSVKLELDWVLVVKWMNVCPYQNGRCVEVIVGYFIKHI